MSQAWLRPVRHPGFWLALWWLAVLIVVRFCMAPPSALPDLPDNSDKLEHALAFFMLSASAVQLYAARGLRIAVVGLLLLGVGIEVAQATLTVDRSGDPFDVLADAVGIGLGLATLRTPLHDLLLRLDGRSGS